LYHSVHYCLSRARARSARKILDQTGAVIEEHEQAGDFKEF